MNMDKPLGRPGRVHRAQGWDLHTHAGSGKRRSPEAEPSGFLTREQIHESWIAFGWVTPEPDGDHFQWSRQALLTLPPRIRRLLVAVVTRRLDDIFGEVLAEDVQQFHFSPRNGAYTPPQRARMADAPLVTCDECGQPRRWYDLKPDTKTVTIEVPNPRYNSAARRPWDEPFKREPRAVKVHLCEACRMKQANARLRHEPPGKGLMKALEEAGW